MFDYKNSKPDDIWDEETGETVKQALERFESFGHLLHDHEVPQFVRHGEEVWSFGYGDDPKAFTTIEESDLEGWDDEMASMWGPFRVNLETPDVNV